MKLIEAKTGKEYKGLAVPRKKIFPEPVEYTSMFSHGFKHLAKLKLTQNENAILFELLSRLDFENWIRVSQRTIAEELDLKEPNVSTVIKKLVGLEIILREPDPSDKRRLVYRLNPCLGWRGEPKEWIHYVSKKDLEPTPPCFVRKK